MARWEDALDALLDTWKWWKSEPGQRYAKGWAQRAQLAPGEGWQQSFVGTLPQIDHQLLFSEPVWVEPDMMTLIDAAAKSYEMEPLREGDLLMQRGFMLLPRPLEVTDIRGKRVTFRAIQWFPFELEAPTDSLPEQDFDEVRLKSDGYAVKIEPEHMPKKGDPDQFVRLRGIGLAFYHGTIAAGDRDDYDVRDKSYAKEHGLTLPPLFLAHYTPWFFNISEGEGFKDDYFDAARWFQAAMRLMQQRISIRHEREPGGAFKNRAERSGHPQRGVVLVTLRRAALAPHRIDEDAEPVDWQMRWLVRGHWKWQWHGKLAATCNHRRADGSHCTAVDGYHSQIWIEGYVKGPEDKPLIVKPMRAFTVSR